MEPNEFKTFKWVSLLPNVNSLRDDTKGELILLSSIAKVEPDFLSSIEFVDDEYLSLAHALFPHIFENKKLDDSTACDLEKQYIKSKLEHTQIYDRYPWDYENPGMLVHQIFFYSDFGRYEIRYSEFLEKYLLDQLVVSKSIEWRVEMMIALHLIGSSIPEDHLNDCVDFYENNEVTVENYHNFLVFDILKAIRRWH